jgi:DHA1 family bicyclomycin/chloramphenicol resistance-like MFS transporter
MSTPPSQLRIFLILSGLAILGPLALDTFLPAIEDAAIGLNTDVGQIMISWGILTVGSAIGQIVHGPLSDRYGRKPVIVIGLFVYVITSFLSTFVTSVEPLFILRFFQGLAIAATMIIMRSVVRDLFGIKEGARLFAYLFAVLAIIPIVGPIAGGHLTIWFGWQSVFYMMAGVSAFVLVIVIIFLKESLKQKDLNALRPKILISNFTEILLERNFLTFLLVGMGSYAGLFAILTGIAPVMIGLLHQPADVFGYQFAAIMTWHFLAATLAGKLVNILGIKKLLFRGTLISMIGGILLFLVTLSADINIYSILIPSAIFLIGFSLTIPGMTAGALSNFDHMAGRATSLLGFIQQGTGATVAIGLGLMTDGSTPTPMAATLAGAGLFAFVTFVSRISMTTLKTE